MSNAHILTDYTAYLTHQRKFSVHTVNNYVRSVHMFESFLKENGEANFTDVANIHVRGFAAHLHAQQLSPRTVHARISALRNFYNFLRERGDVPANPFANLPLPKKEKALPKFLTEAQLRTLLEGPLQRAEKTGTLAAWQNRVILEVLYGAGLRVSELTGLTWECIDAARGCARVLGKGGKQRIAPLGPVATQCLKHYKTLLQAQNPYLTAPHQPILPSSKQSKGGNEKNNEAAGAPSPAKALTPRTVQLRLKTLLAQANLPADITPHKLRHSYATHLLNSGAQLRLVQELLGHASLSSTQVYTHLDLNRLKAAHKQAHPRA